MAGLTVNLGLSPVRHTHQSHQASDSALNVDPMIAKDRDKARLRPNRWSLDIRAVIVHDLLDLVDSFRQKPVQLAREDCGITGDDQAALCGSAQNPKLKSVRLTFCTARLRSMSLALCTPKNSPVIQI